MMSRVVIIHCDDGTGNVLRMTQSDDGDIWLSVIDGEEGTGLQTSVRIRTGQGGGRQHGVRLALQQAMDAAESEE